MPTEVTHIEQWTMEITPDEGETWEDIPVTWTKHDRKIIPVKIWVAIHRPAPGRTRDKPVISVKGHDRLKDGRPGAHLRTIASWDLPPWVFARVEKAREYANLGPGTTGCPW